MKKRIVSLLLALCLAFSLAPAVYGEDGGENPDFYCRTLYYDGLSDYCQTSLSQDLNETRTVYFFSAENGDSPIEFTTVAFRPAEGTASDAVTTTPAQDEAWAITFVHVGSGELVCTTAAGKEYTLPVQAELPLAGLYTALTRDEEHLVGAEITLDAGDSLWLIHSTGFTQARAESIQWRCETKQYSALNVTDYLETELVEYISTENTDPGTGGPFYAIQVTLKQIYGTQMRITATNSIYASCTVINENPPQLTKLAEPSDLHWSDETPGLMCYTVNRPTQNIFQWHVYQVGQTEPIKTIRERYNASYAVADRTGSFFIWGYDPQEPGTEDRNMASGTYYFTLQALGDEVEYSDSDVATSPQWTYVKPEESLVPVTDLRWDGRTIHWTNPNTAPAGEEITYNVEFFRQTDDGEEIESVGGTSGIHETELEMEDYYLSDNGPGTYYVKVRAVSWNISTICNSPWSDYSAPLEVTETVDQINARLDDLANQYSGDGELTADQKTELKYFLSQTGDALEQAMAADQGEKDGTVDKVAALENLVGGPAGVNVSADMTGSFDQTKVSIVGANLNTAGDSTATLNISSADSGTVIPEQYKNTLLFSMKLENVAAGTDGHQQLQVPVRITLPVPGNINPAFLVILHAKTDGGYEEVPFPRTFEQDGVLYASFVVTSFSDFALAEDYGARLTGNGQITVNAPAGADSILAAVYDAQGQLLSTAAKKAPEMGPVTLTPDLVDGDHVKVFFLDAVHAPVVPTVDIPLS